jgi:hypothetical protein
MLYAMLTSGIAEQSETSGMLSVTQKNLKQREQELREALQRHRDATDAIRLNMANLSFRQPRGIGPLAHGHSPSAPAHAEQTFPPSSEALM